jgi:hypothetical protein
MKTIKRNWITLAGIFGGGLIVVVAALTALSQTAPVLTITATGTNQVSITITNGVSTNNYDLYWTPVLGNTVDYPWKASVIGSTGQTNFIVNKSVWQSQFFRVLVDTSGIPVYELADPNNPGAGILTVFIDSPTNGAVLQ